MRYARDVMVPQPVCVNESVLAKDIQDYFSDDPHQILPVLNERQALVGVMTYADFIRSRQIREMKEFLELCLLGVEEEMPDAAELLNLSSYSDAYNTLTVREVMSAIPPVTHEEADIDAVAKVMISFQAPFIIVLNQSEHVVGSIRPLDLLSACYSN